MINKIKTIITMAKIGFNYFRAVTSGGQVTELPAIEIINALKAYKAQNPKKYAQKKEALFARYGIADAIREEMEVILKDENDEELELAEKVVTKKVSEGGKKTDNE